MRKREKVLCGNCSNIKCFVKQHFTESQIRIIEQQKRCDFYPKKNYLFKEGDDFDRIYFLHVGKIKISNGEGNNKEQTISFLKEGDSFGYRGLMPAKTYPVSSQTITDCHVCYVPSDTLFDIVYNDPRLAKFFISFMADTLYRDDAKLKAASILSVREKVANGLLFLISKFGLNEDNEIIDFDFVSRQDFAGLVGLIPNQVTRVFSEFSKDNIITIKGKNIEVNKPGELKSLIKFYNVE